jgi:osmotically-inducible protein OsmY
MKKWAMAFIVILEIFSNASRSSETQELKSSSTKTQADSVILASDFQANKAGDQQLVKKIRQQLLNDEGISKSGKIVQIIVVGKEITLKGPVNSAKEQQRILQIVKDLSGHLKTRDQLEVISIKE